MKNTTADIQSINDGFFRHERGFTENKDIVLFFMKYISYTQEINRDQLKKILDKSKIEGGDIMPTLAQQFREEFMETIGPELKEEGIKEGIKEEKFEIARRMLLNNYSEEQVMFITGLTEQEIRTLIN